MKASDIMTAPVITVGPATRVLRIAVTLLKHRISAVPVMEEGRLVGIVSEADLLHRIEREADCNWKPRWWWRRVFRTDSSPERYIKTHARRARDIMARRVVTISHDAPVAHIANVLCRQGIKRVPVLKGEKLVGIVSRLDLVKALTRHRARIPVVRPPNDESIRDLLMAELAQQRWWQSLCSGVSVQRGVVHYWGLVESGERQEAARVAAENIPGVRGVEDHRSPYPYPDTWTMV